MMLFFLGRRGEGRAGRPEGLPDRVGLEDAGRLGQRETPREVGRSR